MRCSRYHVFRTLHPSPRKQVIIGQDHYSHPPVHLHLHQHLTQQHPPRPASYRAVSDEPFFFLSRSSSLSLIRLRKRIEDSTLPYSFVPPTFFSVPKPPPHLVIVIFDTAHFSFVDLETRRLYNLDIRFNHQFGNTHSSTRKLIVSHGGRHPVLQQ